VLGWGLPPRARAIVCIARDPGVRLRDIATSLGVAEPSVFGIVTGLSAAGYVVNDKEAAGHRTRNTHDPWHSVMPRLEAMSPQPHARVAGDAQQCPGVVGQETPAHHTDNIPSILEIHC
jgi:hypothetical protein